MAVVLVPVIAMITEAVIDNIKDKRGGKRGDCKVSGKGIAIRGKRRGCEIPGKRFENLNKQRKREYVSCLNQLNNIMKGKGNAPSMNNIPSNGNGMKEVYR